MDESTKQNPDNTQDAGEIFKDTQSAYQEAVSSPVEEAPRADIYSQSPPPAPPQEPEISAPSDLGPPPPPYVDDPRKKIIFIVLFIMIILGLGFFFVRVLSNRNKPATTGNNKINITLSYWGLWEEEEILKPIIEDFQKKNEGVTVNYIRQNPIDYRERLQAAIERGEGPDIFRFHNTWLPMLKNTLSPLPKEIMTAEEFTKTFYPVASSDLKSGDNFYGLPLEIDGLLLFYNEDILKGANVPVPNTWVDVQKSVSKLTVQEGGRIITSAIALGTAENIEHFSDILALMMLQNGTVLSKSLSTCTDRNVTDCSIQALKFYRQFAEPPNNTWDNSLENSIIAFAGGKVAMIFAPSWQANVIQTINPDLNFKTAQVPQLPCNQDPCPEVNWASYWVEGVTNKSKNQLQAWEFLKYLASREVQQKLYSEQIKFRKLFGEPYSRVDLAQSLKDNPYLSPLMVSAPTMQSFYLTSRTYDGETGLNSTLITYLKDAVNALEEHGASEETVLNTADSGFQQVFQRFGLSSQ